MRLRRASRSTLQARKTPAASRSSISARRRCSSVAYSCLRSLAYSSARWSAASRLCENDGKGNLLLLHGALKRMAMLTREIHDLRHLGLCHFVRIDTAHADALVVDVQHDARRLFPPLVEVLLKHVHDELHRCVVVVE